MKLPKNLPPKILFVIIILPILIATAIFIFRPVLVEECCTIAGVQTQVTPKIFAPEPSVSEDHLTSPDMVTSIQISELIPIPPLLIFVIIYLITLVITISFIQFSVKRKNVPSRTHM